MLPIILSALIAVSSALSSVAAHTVPEQDSTAVTADLLRKEALILAEKASRQGVIDIRQKDSLVSEINRIASSETDIRVISLKEFINKLDEEYDAYMKIADKRAEAIIERYEWLFHKPLDLPSDYISPEERSRRINEYTASAVLKSIMDNLNAERLWGWQRWLQKSGIYLLGNDGVYSGRLIPQMGGLYYIAVPGGAPPPENPYKSERFKKLR